MERTRWEPLDWASFAYSFGQRLVILRRWRGHSQERLAELAGMHRNQISNLERGTSNRTPYVSDPQLSTVYRLARALEVPAAYLLPDLRTPVPDSSIEYGSAAGLSAVEETMHGLLEQLDATGE